MRGSWILGLVILLGSTVACRSSSPDAGIGPQLEIIYEAGTMPDLSWNYLPYPAHYGKMNNNHIFLLSKAPSISSTRSIVPIGMLITIEDGKDENWIIANDAHVDYKINGLDNVNDLMTNHNGIKSTLERWILNRKEVGQIQLKGWKETPSIDESNNQ